MSAAASSGSPSSRPVFVEQVASRLGWLVWLRLAFLTLVFGLTGQDKGLVVSYGSEAGQFQERGLPTVLCGPGSIDQAHQPDEFIEISQVTACERQGDVEPGDQPTLTAPKSPCFSADGPERK